VRERVGQRVREYGGDRDLALLLFDDPERLRGRFLDLLQEYWLEAFRDEWQRLEGSLLLAVAEGQAHVATDGIYSLVGQLGHRLVADRSAGEFDIDSPHHHRVRPTAANPLFLVPSAFVWPNVQVNCDGPFPLSVIYPAPPIARTARPASPDPRLVRVLRALADETRLRTLRLIAEAPRSTQELAALVLISEAGLSKHLKTLGDAGLVDTRREGYYVLYSLNTETVEALPAELRAFLG